MRKKPFVILFSLLLLTLVFMGGTVVNVNASPVTQPVGTMVLKALDIPEGTPSGSQLAWSFNSFVANATSGSPTCTNNVTQQLSADANKTIDAGSISTVLSKVYADDDDPYRVPAKNETANLYWIAKFDMNVTLDNHFIKNEAWITGVSVTIKGNSSIQCDTNANAYIYNFTSSAWVDMGTDLNSTTKATLTYNVPSGNETFFVDEAYSNAILLEFYFYDSTDTSFNVDIDYLAVSVDYNLTINVNNWAVSQINATLPVGAPSKYNATYWENYTLATPTDVTNHNFTVYAYPPDQTLLADHLVYVNESSVSSTITNGEVCFNVTNLVSNATGLKFTAKDIIEVTYPKVHYSIGSLQYSCEAHVKNAFSELIAENVTFSLEDWITTNVAEIHQEAIDYTNYQNGTQITTYPTLNINPTTLYNFTRVETLPVVHIIESTEAVLTSVSFEAGLNKLKYTATATGSKTFALYSSIKPFNVYVDDISITYTYDSTSKNLTFTYDFGSTHTFQIYQYSGITPPPAPSPKPAPTPSLTETIEKASPTEENISLWIITIILVAAGLIIYTQRRR